MIDTSIILWNFIVSLAGFLGMWQFISLHKRLDRLDSDLAINMLRVQAIELLAAGLSARYVTIMELKDMHREVVDKLNRIEDMLHKKADK